MPLQTESQKQRKAAENETKTRKQKTARANGANSRGPTTQAGRDKISQINTRHGMRANRLNPLLIPNEDVDKLNEITVAYYDHIRPANAAEATLVDLLIASIWRGARLITYEAELIIDKAEDLHPTLAETYESISSDRLFALAFEAINGKGSANPTLNRYLATTRNAYHSTLSDIERLRKIKGDPTQPYYQPKLAKQVPLINLDFPKPEPIPEPEPEPEPQVGRSPGTAQDPPVLPAEPEPKPEPKIVPPPTGRDLKSFLARAVPNPNAPYSPNTIWIHLIGSDGKTLRDVNENPILWPVHIGPEIPKTPTTNVSSLGSSIWRK
jgi:hypothetical protein